MTMSCCTPAGLIYLRSLLQRRLDIAVFPPDALDSDDPPDNVYFYRPGEILVPFEQVKEFEVVATRLGIRYVRYDDSSDHDRDPLPPSREELYVEVPDREQLDQDFPDVLVVEADSRDNAIGPDGTVARFLVSATGELEYVLSRLERAAPGLQVSPNHVWFGTPLLHFEPYGDPTPIAMGGLRANDNGKAGVGVAVAVVDSGLPRHYTQNSVLAAVKVDAPASSEEEQWEYQSSKILKSPQGHGSFVAGVVRLNAPGAEVRAYLTLLTDDNVTDQVYLTRRIQLALDDGARILNLSLGGYTRNDVPPLGFAVFAETAENGDPLWVAAAGNNDNNRPFWPAAETWVIGVGAAQMLDDAPVKAVFSDRGNWPSWPGWVNACAIGVDVASAYEAHPYQTSTDPSTLLSFNGAAMWKGTSFATPMVAAVLAARLAQVDVLTRQDAMSYLATRTGIVIPHLGVFVQ
jgi:hypothetical protein